MTESKPSRPKLQRFISKFGSSSKNKSQRDLALHPSSESPSSSQSATTMQRPGLPSFESTNALFLVGSGPPTPSERFSLIDLPDMQDILYPLSRPLLSPTRPIRQSPSLLPKLWNAILSASRHGSKGEAKYRYPLFDAEGNLLPLGGEEGELVEDEGYFDIAVLEKELPMHNTMDIVAALPFELSIQIFLLLDLSSLLRASLVSRTWHYYAYDRLVWRELFLTQCTWKVDLSLARRRISSRASSYVPPSFYGRFSRTSLQSAVSLPRATVEVPLSSLQLDWPKLYKHRHELDRRWLAAEPRVTRLTGHTDGVYCIAFDKHKVISGSRDRTIKIWSLTTRRTLATLRGHEASVLCLQLDSPAGILVSGSSDKTLRVWDLGNLKSDGSTKPVGVLRGHTGGVLDVALDEKWIVSCSKDSTIRIWCRRSLAPLYVLAGHGGPVNALGLSSSHIVSASGDGLLLLWAPLSSPVVPSATLSTSITLTNPLRVFPGHTRGLASLAFSHPHRTLISGSSDSTIKVWNTDSGECLTTLNEPHDKLIRALCVDWERGLMASAGYDRRVCVWQLEGLRLKGNQDGLVVREGGGQEEAKASVMRLFKDHHSSQIFDVKFDSTRIVSASHDASIIVMDFALDLDTSLFP